MGERSRSPQSLPERQHRFREHAAMIALIACVCTGATNSFLFSTTCYHPQTIGGVRTIYSARNDLPALVQIQVRLFSSNHVSFEYCTDCRWGLRASWMMQELLTTFADDPNLEAVTLVPSTTAGRFLVSCTHGLGTVVLWDRSVHKRFPEMKELKQLVRDRINPKRSLGHSDSEERKDWGSELNRSSAAHDQSFQKFPHAVAINYPSKSDSDVPYVTIVYCTQRLWMFRTACLAQELLSKFPEDIYSITLVPSRPPEQAGKFTLRIGNDTIWDCSGARQLPELNELTDVVANRIDPTETLGDVDLPDELENDEAEAARKFFGVL